MECAALRSFGKNDPEKLEAESISTTAHVSS